MDGEVREAREERVAAVNVGQNERDNKFCGSFGGSVTAALSTLCICQFCDSAADADNEGVVECFNCRSRAHKKVC